MKYFAYGSNMSAKRLNSRIPAVRLGVVRLQGYMLVFTKPSELDGSAKCDICSTESPDDTVYGVLYEIEESHKAVLDKFEGLGYGYTSELITVSFNGQSVKAVTYKAVTADHTLKPFNWYKTHVIRGAEENNMPPEYIEKIWKVESRRDPDIKRSAGELSIYL